MEWPRWFGRKRHCDWKTLEEAFVCENVNKIQEIGGEIFGAKKKP
jgi:hypothetical protein